MGTKGQDRGEPSGGRQSHTSQRREARRLANNGMAGDTGYLVSCWRGKLRSCRGFATLAEARQAAARHVYDAGDAFTEDRQALADSGFLAAASWALAVDPQPDRPAACDLADGTRIRLRLISAATARCLR